MNIYNKRLFLNHFKLKNENIFSKDDDGNTVFYKWGGISKPSIVNNEEVQQELEEFIQAKDALLGTSHGNAFSDYLKVLTILPTMSMSKPFRIIALILGAPIYFGLKYIFPTMPIVLGIFIAFISVLIVFMWDYSNQVDRILNK